MKYLILLLMVGCFDGVKVGDCFKTNKLPPWSKKNATVKIIKKGGDWIEVSYVPYIYPFDNSEYKATVQKHNLKDKGYYKVDCKTGKME